MPVSEAMQRRMAGGVWLKRKREAAGLTQRELAARIGMANYTFVSQIEAGAGRPQPDQYAAWAEAVGVDRRDFAQAMLGFYDPHTHAALFGEPELAGAG